MKKMAWLAVLALGGILACSQVASGQEAKEGKKGPRRGPGMEQQMERLSTDLKLTDAQKPKVEEILKEGQKKRQELFSDNNASQDDRRQKMRTLMEEQNKKMKAVLTPEQLEKWDKMREEMRGKRGPGAPGEGGKKKKTE